MQPNEQQVNGGVNPGVSYPGNEAVYIQPAMQGQVVQGAQPIVSGQPVTMNPMMATMVSPVAVPEPGELKMSKKMVLATLGIVTVIVVAGCALIAGVTHSGAALADTEMAPIEIAPIAKVGALDRAVGELLGGEVEESTFATNCTNVQKISSCEGMGNGMVYGLVSDHQILEDKAYAFVRLGTKAIGGENYEDFPVWRLEFDWDGDGYEFVEAKKL